MQNYERTVEAKNIKIKTMESRIENTTLVIGRLNERISLLMKQDKEDDLKDQFLKLVEEVSSVMLERETKPANQSAHI